MYDALVWGLVTLLSQTQRQDGVALAKQDPVEDAMRAQCLASLGLLVFVGSSHAADLSGALPSKAPPPAASASYDWTGLYVGGHLGYKIVMKQVPVWRE